MQREFDLYGIDNFTFDVIDEANSLKELNEKEIFYISKYDSFNNEKGYNLCEGGNGPVGTIWNESSRKGVSEQRKASKWFHNEKGERHLVRVKDLDKYKNWIPGYGPGRKRKPQSEETKKKIKESNLGKHNKTKEQIENQIKTFKSKERHWYTNGTNNISLTKYDKIPEGFYRGKVLTPEQKIKCGIKNIGKQAWNKGLTKETDERVKQYSERIKNTLAKKTS